jgi:hypothetical protein
MQRANVCECTLHIVVYSVYSLYYLRLFVCSGRIYVGMYEAQACESTKLNKKHRAAKLMTHLLLTHARLELWTPID